MTDFDPVDMFLFAKVVEHGSLSSASRLTGTPKATISRAMSRLEHKLQARLLERSVRRTTATEAGQVFYEYCRRVSSAIEEAQDAVGALQGKVRGTLKVGSSLTIGQTLLNKLIPDFVACHPDLRVNLELTNRNIDLVEEGFDVALRAGPLPDSTLVARELASLVYGVFSSPQYLSAKGAPKHPCELEGTWVVDNFSGRASVTWGFTSATCEPVSIEVKPRLDFNDAVMRREALVKGAGIGRVPRWICQGALDSGALVEVLPDWTCDRVVRVYALWPSRRYPTPRLRAFLDHLEKHLPPLLGTQR
ncbi:MAG: LysR family transcriptional regulator [Burkholderiales bacterium]|nr:LysR family transcriptional regulator [Burkholderiales bacterium]